MISGVCLLIACAMLTGIDPATPFAWLLAAYVVFGLGFGFVNAPITNAAVSGMPRAQAGVASAIATTSRQVGQTLGVAVVGAIVTSHAGAVGPVVGKPPGLVDAHRLRRRRAGARCVATTSVPPSRLAGRRRRSIRKRWLHRLGRDGRRTATRTRGLAADVRPRARQPAAARGLRGARA